MPGVQQSLQELVGRLPRLQKDHDVQRACQSTDGLQILGTWQKLLVAPTTTLPAAGCLHGNLLSMVSMLIDTVLSGKAEQLQIAQSAAVLAVLRLLELNPNISRLLPRLLQQAGSPLHALLSHHQQQLAAAPPPPQAAALQTQTSTQPLPVSAAAAAVSATADPELLALVTLRALQLHPALAHTWQGSSWFKLLGHQLPVVRWVAVRGISTVLGLTDATESQLMSQQLSVQEQVAAQLRWGEERTAVALELARRWQPCPQGALCCSCSDASTHRAAGQQQQQQQQKQDQQLLPPAKGFVRFCGLQVPTRSGDSTIDSVSSSSSSGGAVKWGCLVQTATITAALESAVLALSQGLPIAVEGPPGCGKTTLICALAAATGNDANALWLHLDDQQDAKSLLGSYSCSAVPGEFVWQMGPLARAVVEGRWVVIENVDKAPPDILAALLPLLESGVLQVPSRGQMLTAAPGFQVLGTVNKTTTTSSSSAAHDMLGGLWAIVRLQSPTEAEQLTVLQGLYTELTPLLPVVQAIMRLVQMAAGPLTAAVQAAAAGAEGGGQSWQQQVAAAALRGAGLRPGELALSLSRQFGTRDLIKWCSRMVCNHGVLLQCMLRPQQAAIKASDNFKISKRHKAAPAAAGALADGSTSGVTSNSTTPLDLSRLDHELKYAAFTETADLFAGLVAKHDAKLKLLAAVAGVWCLADPAGVAEQYEDLAKPNLSVGTEELQIGRASLLFQQSSTAAAQTGNTHSFTPTGHALRVMERVGVCLSRGEPVLLVGETGTGKTTTLSRLAALTGANLVALNMSQQSDSSDLLGGFRPVGPGEALVPLLDRFGELLRKTWKRGSNEEFLSRTLKYAQRKKWGHLLAAYKAAIAKLKLDEAAAAATADAGSNGSQQQYEDTSGTAAKQTAAASSSSAAATQTAMHYSGGAGRGRVGSKGKATTAAAGDSTRKKKQKVAADDSFSPPVAAAATANGPSTAADASSVQQQQQQLSSQRLKQWRHFAADVEAAERASNAAEGGFAFAFIEGALVKALRNGWWLLLDEINLAPPEVLERIAGILEAHPPPTSNVGATSCSAGFNGGSTIESNIADASSGLLLVERGDVSIIHRHPRFRLVAAMNPATDAGKRDLPPQLRSRFTEFWVSEPRSREDLAQLVGGYLAGTGPSLPMNSVVDLYLAAKATAETKLTDGAGQRPAYSLRTLCRALDFARQAAPVYGLQRALWDGFSMSFLTQLSPESAPKLEGIMVKQLLPGGTKALKTLLRPPSRPTPGNNHVLFEQFWLERGPLPLPALGAADDGSARRFVLTPSVRQQCCNLARCVLAHRHPILLQGPTSSGKTSLVAYLAAQTGHKFVRINNHQHTDLQEYLGSWVPDEQGRLVFREGALVSALRQGHWIVLDELNLAPTEVLEALNRLLDDNRELFVPELQEVVRPHPHFMLFATQNPPGAYAGRKALSRAFRGRILELHVEELPDSELADILHQRCGVAPSYAAKMVMVMRELQRRRQRSNVFAGRHGFITPRDLFRWAERGAVGYEQLAVDGFMVLGERLRGQQERGVVAEVLEQVLRIKLDMYRVYQEVGSEPLHRLQEAAAAADIAHQQAAVAAAAATPAAADGPVQVLAAAAAAESAAIAAAAASEEAAAIQAALSGIVWTHSMKRLYTLVDRCLRHQEPVLLVGETGTGKTSVCQLLALMRHTHLHVLNCNQHTETSDFLGGYRPTRSRDRDLAQFRAVAQELLASPAWHFTGLQVSSELAAAAAEAASPVEIEQVLQGVLAEVGQLQEVLRKARQLQQQQNQQQQQQDAAAAKAAAGILAADLQRLSQQLADGVVALLSAATACRTPFSWVDGPLVVAMRQGELLLVDELNLAEDAVLERLNSVLEAGRTLTLAEKGGGGAEVIVGAPGFMVLATMNPGGDFGKKELSPALSNRFTQIWVPAISDQEELLAILESRLAASAVHNIICHHLLNFWQLYISQAPVTARGALSVRDLLAWVEFINAASPRLGVLQAYAHGAYLTLLDGFGLGSGVPPALLAPLKQKCRQLLQRQLSDAHGGVTAKSAAAGAKQQQQPAMLTATEAAAVVAQAAGQLQQPVSSAAVSSSSSRVPVDTVTCDGRWGIHPFFIEQAAAADNSGRSSSSFIWSAPTTCRNAFRLLRAMQLSKAMLLEGSPGVGKTSLVSALAKAAGAQLVRINCSEHTDMIDLLGADLPAPGGAAGQFAWCNGPLLSAVVDGHWVLLDELNLAGQSVLEGLNGLLDHRQALFVPELGRSFKAHPSFRLFAAQNPLQEGGGRKGLPKSFLNRFTRVTVELLQPEDLKAIAAALHPQLPDSLVNEMVGLLSAMQSLASSSSSGGGRSSSSSSTGSEAGRAGGSDPFAAAGGPWEFNVRDLLRWCELVCKLAANQQQGTVQAAAAGHGQQPVQAMDVDQPTNTLQQQQQPGSDQHAVLDAVAEHCAGILFSQRLRTTSDRHRLRSLFQQVWGRPMHAASSLAGLESSNCTAARITSGISSTDSLTLQQLGSVGFSGPGLQISPQELCVGLARIQRAVGAAASVAHGSPSVSQPETSGVIVIRQAMAQQQQQWPEGSGAGAHQQHQQGRKQQRLQQLLLPSWQAPVLESMVCALAAGWPVLLLGPSGSGKTSLARVASGLVGVDLLELGLTQGTDTSDLLGSFEQVEPARKVQDLAAEAHRVLTAVTQHLLLLGAAVGSSSAHKQPQHALYIQAACDLQQAWHVYSSDAAAVSQQQQKQQKQQPGSHYAADTTAAAGSQSPADTVRQLKQLHVLLQRLQQLPQGLQQLQQTSAETQKQQQLCESAARYHLQQLQQLHSQGPHLAANCTALLQQLNSPAGSSTAGRFEWVDGALTRAVQQGSWVLLDNANLVNPAVLDRLNALLEPGGVLQLDEGGAGGTSGSETITNNVNDTRNSVNESGRTSGVRSAAGGRVVVPHPGFRLILAYDPRHGEVSRAMRNRGLELYLLPPTPVADGATSSSNTLAAAASAAGSAGADSAPQVSSVPDLTWSLSGQPDLETLLASTGVTSSAVLQAMATAHTSMAAACTKAHRRAPGFKEARTWAAAAETLLQQGRCLQQALWQAWAQVYMRGFAVTNILSAEAQAAYVRLCKQLQLQPPGEALHCNEARSLQSSDAVELDMLDTQQLQQQQQQLMVAGQPSSIWPNPLLRPCQWPVWIGLAELAQQSVFASVTRDASLPAWLLGQALSAAAAAASPDQSLAVGLLQRLPASQQALLSGSLSADVHSGSSKRLHMLLPMLVLKAAAACAIGMPAAVQSHGSSKLMEQWLQQQFQHVAAAAAALSLSSNGSKGWQLGETAHQLLSLLPQQPWYQQLQQLLAECPQQLLLMSHPTLLHQQLQQLLPLLQHAALQAAIIAGADTSATAATAAGAATSYQESVFRKKRPSERVRSEASHSAVDSLHPCLAAVAKFESAALQLLMGALQQQWQADAASRTEAYLQPFSMLAVQLARLQQARAEVWAVCHGPLHVQCSVSNAAAVFVLEPERLAWSWHQLVKAVNCLLPTLLNSSTEAEQSHNRWHYLVQQMNKALHLDVQAPKPLLWKFGGHPQLPANKSLLTAQHKAVALADALAVAGGAGFRVNGMGQPAAFTAAGLDWQQLMQQAVQAVQQQQQQAGKETAAGDDDNEDSMAVDVSGAAEQLDVSSSSQDNGQLAAAAAAVLASDVRFRRSVAQGLALLGFMPHMQLLAQHGHITQAASGAANAADSSLCEVSEVLKQQAAAQVQRVMVQLLQLPQQQQQESAGAAAVIAALRQCRKGANSSGPGVKGAASSATGAVVSAGAAAEAGAVAAGALWRSLPARAMVSAAARQLQVDLQQLVHAADMLDEAHMVAKALMWLASAIADGAFSAPNQQQLHVLQSRLSSHLAAAAASCERSAAALVPLQQLAWLLNILLDDTQQRQLPQQQLLHKVLPGLLHEAYYSWQLGLWASSQVSGEQQQQQVLGARMLGAGLGKDAKALLVPFRILASPLSLHLASQTAAVIRICAFGDADGTSKPVRLLQLALAVQQLQATAAAAAAEQYGLSNNTSSSTVLASAQQWQAATAWSQLSFCLAQILLAHRSSFSCSQDAAQLQQLMQQLLAWCSPKAACSSGSNERAVASAADLQAWLEQLQAILKASGHSTLVAVVDTLLLPCAKTVVLQIATPQQQQQQQQAWYSAMGVQGWGWMLLGCARLQLVAPPAGVDPAGKYGYKCTALNRWLTDHIHPAIQTSGLMQQLQGAAHGMVVLQRQQLLQQQSEVTGQIQGLQSSCVPRPEPPQYLHLQQAVSGFMQGLADSQRLLAVAKMLLANSQASSAPIGSSSNIGSANDAAAAAQAAVGEAELWSSSAAAWSQRMQVLFPDYTDILQPVQLAVLEIRHGLILLVAASQAAQQAALHATHQALGHQLAANQPDSSSNSSSNNSNTRGGSGNQVKDLTAGLLSFPPPLATLPAVGSSSGSNSSSAVITAAPASLLAHQHWQQAIGDLITHHQQQQQQNVSKISSSSSSSSLSQFTWQLKSVHAALTIAVQELLLAGPAAAAAAGSGNTAATGTAAVASGSDGVTSLCQAALQKVHCLLDQMLSVWQSVQAFEQQAAEEAAQLFKHKTQISTFVTEEEEAAADYKAQFPDHYAAFADLTDEPLDPDLDQQPQQVDVHQAQADASEDATAAAATELQARSAAAKSLLEGELLQDVASLHQQLFTALAAQKLQQQLAAAAGPGPESQQQNPQQGYDDATRERAFTLCFNLGQQLVAAQQGLLPKQLDGVAQPGLIMALALQHRSINTTAAANAAAAAVSPATSQDNTANQLDMQRPFAEEVYLMQQPLSTMSVRLNELLDEWPEHPLLLQLLAIVDRLLGLPVTVPLKQALTGLELLLARAQVWEETAAHHVSLQQQLAAVSGLATRWRKLELASWRGLLERVKAKHAAGALKSWYYLYQLLVLDQGKPPSDPAAAASDTAVGAAAATPAADGSNAAGANAGNGDAAYRRVASLVEAFIQTSTVGEYTARLQLLRGFACQLTVTAAAKGSSSDSSGSHTAKVAFMLWNVMSYYSQFLPAVTAAINAGHGPLSKELSDFVKLAKWEDRGYYAMRVATEKAQRQLHRLSRRAEDCLKQPAAAVLATASQGMGLEQVTAPKAAQAAAAAAGKAASKVAKAEAASAKEGQQQQKGAAAAGAASAEVDSALLAELDPLEPSVIQGLGLGLYISSLDSFAASTLNFAPTHQSAAMQGPKDSYSKRKKGSKALLVFSVTTAPLAEALQHLQPLEQPAWSSYSTAVLQNQVQLASQLQQEAAIGSSGGSSNSSGYAAQLPQLAMKMARVLAPVEPQAQLKATAAEGGESAGPGSCSNSSPGLQLEELAAIAASRALALSADVSKGARSRKKKALTDLLHALGDVGLSKRASAVPASDRDPAAWFSHNQPCLSASPLLHALQSYGRVGSATAAATTAASASFAAVHEQQLQLASSCWAKADSYYFKSLARLQRLQSAAKQPHKDLAGHEVLAMVAFTQHQLYLLRQQRGLLGEAAEGFTQLMKAAKWLQEVTAAAGTGSTAAAVADTGAAIGSRTSSTAALPHQRWARTWLFAAQQLLASLSYQLSAARQLVAAVIPMQQQSVHPQQVITCSSGAMRKLERYVTVITNHKAAVEAESARLCLAGCPFVGHSAVAAVAAAMQAVSDAQSDAAAATEAMAAALLAAGLCDDGSNGSSSKAVVCRMVAGWDGVLDALQAAANVAAAFNSEQKQQQRGAAVVHMRSIQQQYGRCLEQLVAQVLLAAQALHSEAAAGGSSSDGATQQQEAEAAAQQAGKTTAAAGGVVYWSSEASHALRPNRLSNIAAAAWQLLRSLAQASDISHSTNQQQQQQAMLVQAAAVAPLLQLLLGALQRRVCQLLVLHKSLAKLSFICSSIFCSLVCEGYCMPEGTEGTAQEGEGTRELTWQNAGGTGMGEGTGKEDVSNQIQNEDQLLGAQQKDQQQQEQQQDHGLQEDGSAQGVEMDADFDGSLHDIDDRRQQQGDDSAESEEGDDDRIQQQMGEVGDNQERVDERLWNDDDDPTADQDKQQQQQPGHNGVDRQQQLQVQDKSNLEYADGGEDDHQQQQKLNKQQQQGQQSQQQEDAADDKQQQEQEERLGDQGEPAIDIDDSYQQQHKLAPENAEQELELPEDLNLDGMEEDEPQEQHQQQHEGEKEGDYLQQQQGKDSQAANAAMQDADAADEHKQPGGEDYHHQQQQQQGDGQEQDDAAAEDEHDQAAVAGQALQQQNEEQPGDADPDGDGIKCAVAEQQQQLDEQQQQQEDHASMNNSNEDLEATAVHGAGKEGKQQPPEQLPQAGPQGVASAAAPEAQAQGAADASQQQQDASAEQQQSMSAEGQPMQWEDQQQVQDAAQQAQQSMLGAAGATDEGHFAPMQHQGMTEQPQQSHSWQQQQVRRQQQPELNPLRSLGDALERWRVNLVVQHEAAQQDEDDQAAAADGDSAAAMQGQLPTADEYQFLGQHEQQQEGALQALLPATEEQAQQQQQGQELAMQQQQGQGDKRQQGADGDEQQQQQVVDDQQQSYANGAAAELQQTLKHPSPRVWGGNQNQQQQQKQQGATGSEPHADVAAAMDAEQHDAAAQQREQQQKLLQDSTTAWGASAADTDQLPSIVAARLAAADLLEDSKADLLGPADQTQLLSGQLSPEQVEALHAELDARLREAATATADRTAADAANAAAGAADTQSAAAYGREMWDRCEALVSGLAGELAEQLRLILEPSLATRLGGEFRSGKRLNMKRVIGYIASHFRRDKIWMRRNRPDKRKYQVVIAVDDSRSMAENGAGVFAIEALALLCKAMSRLEVGELGVVSYGGAGGVQPLQPLEVPFSDAAGPRIMSSLRFDQDNTIADRPMLQLVEAVHHLLEVAKHRMGNQGSGSGSSDLRQLLLVLGDGRFHEKEALMGAVRKLVEVQGVCPVFIALDATASSSSSGANTAAVLQAGSSGASGSSSSSSRGASLLDMQSVKFVNGKPVFERYLDSFPFPYYIVLRDIAALPATLADLLRQWFELNASSS